jgi:hypothetical protein
MDPVIQRVRRILETVVLGISHFTSGETHSLLDFVNPSVVPPEQRNFDAPSGDITPTHSELSPCVLAEAGNVCAGSETRNRMFVTGDFFEPVLFSGFCHCECLSLLLVFVTLNCHVIYRICSWTHYVSDRKCSFRISRADIAWMSFFFFLSV